MNITPWIDNGLEINKDMGEIPTDNCEIANQNISFSFESTNLESTLHRDWHNYNQGQINELEMFDGLLKDLSLNIQEPEKKLGRPSLSTRDMIYYAIKKVYHGMSSRRSKGLFEEDSPHFNAVGKFLNKKTTTQILHELIRLSSLPVADVEKDFAIDSTGFRCSSFGQYCGQKHQTKREHHWIKLHACTGVKTNIVTAVIISDRNSNDAPMFKELLYRTAEEFSIREISADKAYSSRENHNVAGEVGADAYIPFRSNARRTPKGSPLWREAYYKFQLHQEEFYLHYHKRSNVETTFGAIKNKLGETIRSKNETSQINELLCKILAYNITVLIRVMYELNIDLHLNPDDCT